MINSKHTISQELRKVAEMLESHESLLEEIQRLGNIGHWDWNIKDDTLYWSEEIYRIFGLDHNKSIATYSAQAERIHPDDRLDVQQAVEASLQDDIPYHTEHRIIKPNGEVRWVEENGEITSKNGMPIRMIGTVKDITTQREHSIQTERYSRILQMSFEEIYIFDAKTFKFCQVSKGTSHNLGYSQMEIKKLTPWDIKPEFTKKQFIEHVQPLIDSDVELIKIETVHQRKDGSTYDVDIRLQYTGGTDPVFIALVTDISDRKQYEEELKTLAFRDSDTNLYNKRFFAEQLDVSVNKANRDKHGFGLILIDLDDFSDVNNTYGHVVGDKLIKEIAKRIEKVFPRKGDIVARFGGDEFTVLCYNMDPKMLKKKCDQLVKRIARKFSIKKEVIPHSASVGLCIFDASEETTCKDLLNKADSAMYEAKAAGKNQYKVYNEIE